MKNEINDENRSFLPVLLRTCICETTSPRVTLKSSSVDLAEKFGGELGGELGGPTNGGGKLSRFLTMSPIPPF